MEQIINELGIDIDIRESNYCRNFEQYNETLNEFFKFGAYKAASFFIEIGNKVYEICIEGQGIECGFQLRIDGELIVNGVDGVEIVKHIEKKINSIQSAENQ